MSRSRLAHIGTVLLVAAMLALGACSSSSSTKSGRKSSASSTSTSGAPASTGASTTTKPSGSSGSGSCTVPTSQVISALGVSVVAPEVQHNQTVTVCTYKPAAGALKEVIIRFETGTDSSSFATGRNAFGHNGQPTKDLTGLGDKAFTSTLGTGQFVTNTVVVLKGSTQLLVTAGAPLPRIEALVRQVLTTI